MNQTLEERVTELEECFEILYEAVETLVETVEIQNNSLAGLVDTVRILQRVLKETKKNADFASSC